jgi:hypothetical protein
MRYGGQNIVYGYLVSNDAITNGYGMWLDNTPNRGKKECLAAAPNAVANKVCASMGGNIISTAGCPLKPSLSCNRYGLP